MKKSIQKITTTLLTLTLLTTPFTPVSNIQAMTKANKTAHTKLTKYLDNIKEDFFGAESNATFTYAFKDIDGDKVDELIACPGFGYCTEVVCDYTKGKVIKVAGVGQGTFTTFYPKNKVIFIADSGHQGVLFDYYLKRNAKTKEYETVAAKEKQYAIESDYTDEPEKITYTIKDKEVTKAKYNAYVKKLKKDSKAIKHSKLKWHNYGEN